AGALLLLWPDLSPSASAPADAAVRARRIGGTAAIGLGVAAGIGAALLARSAYALRADAPPFESQRDATLRNDRIESRNYAALGLSVGALAAGTSGVILLLWPHPSAPLPEIDVAA